MFLNYPYTPLVTISPDNLEYTVVAHFNGFTVISVF